MTVGKSDVTPFKQADFQHWCKCYINKTIKVYEKYSNEEWFNDNLLFVDASCGDMNPNEITSPQIFLESLLSYCKKETFASLYLVDIKRQALRKTLKQYKKRYEEKIQKTNIEVFFRRKDMREILQDLGKGKYRYGLLYFDPNGFKMKDYISIQNFLQGNPRMDVILNLNIGIMKRVVPAAKKKIEQGEGGRWLDYKNFDLKYSLLEKLNKQFIWVRDDVKIHQRNIKSNYKWIMIAGTNMENFDPNLKKNHHFVPLDSPEGQEIVNKYHI